MKERPCVKNNDVNQVIPARYDRQEKIRGWDQQALLRAHVIVAGAGAIGNEVIKNLCMAGIGHLTLIDDDIIEISNLSRTILFKDSDMNQPKAVIAGMRAKEINPDVQVRAIQGNLFYDVGLGIYRHADLVIGALDNNAARLHLTVVCSLVGKPYLDGAMWAFGGEVRWFLNQMGACFECTLSDDDKKNLHERRSCTGFKRIDPHSLEIPTTVVTTSIIGGLLVQEAIAYLLGWPIHPSEAIVYDGRARSLHRSELSQKPDCPNHGAPYDQIIELEDLPDHITPKALIQKTYAFYQDRDNPLVLELGRDCLMGYYCKACDTYEDIGAVLSKIDESTRVCPTCNELRQADIISQVVEDDSFSDRPLSYFGVPQGEIIAVRSDRVIALYELGYKDS